MESHLIIQLAPPPRVIHRLLCYHITNRQAVGASSSDGVPSVRPGSHDDWWLVIGLHLVACDWLTPVTRGRVAPPISDEQQADVS